MGGVVSRSKDKGKGGARSGEEEAGSIELAASLLSALADTASKRPLSLAEFSDVLARDGAMLRGTFATSLPPEEEARALAGECFRFIDANGNGVVEEHEAKEALAALRGGPGGGAGGRGLLRLVQVGDGKTADLTFAKGEYSVQVLDKDTVLHRVGVRGRPLGQFFTESPYEKIADVRSGVAVKDDWEVAGLTLREVFRPSIDTRYAVTVPKGTVVFRGRAAALEELMDGADSLARRVFRGGDEQLVVVRPWQVGGGSWGVEASPMPEGYCWDVIQYEPTPACRAAMVGDIAALESLGPGEADAASPVVGLSPMHHAAIAGGVAALEALVRKGASPSLANHMGLTPAMVAAVCGRAEALSFLLRQEGVTGNEVEGQLGRGALHLAAAFGVEASVGALLESAKVDPNLPAADGSTSLWSAAVYGHAGAAQLLAGAAGADLERGMGGVTPLQAAVLKGHGGVAEALLGAGARAPPLSDGTTLLEVAIGTKRATCVRALVSPAGLKAGVDPDGELAGPGMPPLAFAVRAASAAEVEALAGAAGGAWEGADGEGLIHLAVRRGDLAVLGAALGAAGAQVDRRSKDGYTPLYMAAAMGNEGAVARLCSAGADPGAGDGDGWTPLHVAANKGLLGVARALLAGGAKADARNNGAVPGDMAKSDDMRALLGCAPTGGGGQTGAPRASVGGPGKGGGGKGGGGKEVKGGGKGDVKPKKKR